MKATLKTIAFTITACTALVAIGYGYAITTQLLVIPDHTGYIQTTNHKIALTPKDFYVDPRDPIGSLVSHVTQKPAAASPTPQQEAQQSY